MSGEFALLPWTFCRACSAMPNASVRSDLTMSTSPSAWAPAKASILEPRAATHTGIEWVPVVSWAPSSERRRPCQVTGLAPPQQPQGLDGVGHERQRRRPLEAHGVQHHRASCHQGDEGPAPAHFVDGGDRGRGGGRVTGVGVGDRPQPDGAGGPGRRAQHLRTRRASGPRRPPCSTSSPVPRPARWCRRVRAEPMVGTICRPSAMPSPAHGDGSSQGSCTGRMTTGAMSIRRSVSIRSATSSPTPAEGIMRSRTRSGAFWSHSSVSIWAGHTVMTLMPRSRPSSRSTSPRALSPPFDAA